MTNMRVDVYRLLTHAVDEGLASGIRRFYKHRDDTPADDVLSALAEALSDAIMSAVCDWFQFGAEDR